MYSVFASVESAVCFIRVNLFHSPDYCLCQLTRVYNCFTHVGLLPYTCLNLQWWSVSLANIYFLFNLPVSTSCLARDNAYSTRLSVWHVPHPSLQAIPLSWVYSLFDTHESILELSWLSLQYLCSTALQVWDLLCKLYDWSAVRVMWYFPKPIGGPSSIWQMSPSWTIDRMQNLCGLWCQSSLLPVPCKTSFITRWEASFLDRFASHSICS